MKKSIITRLFGGPVLLVLTIVLGALVFFAGTSVDRTVSEDARYLAALGERLSFIELRAALLSQGLDERDLGARIAEVRAADAALLGLLAGRGSTGPAAMVYPSGMKGALAGRPGTADRCRGADLRGPGGTGALRGAPAAIHR